MSISLLEVLGAFALFFLIVGVALTQTGCLTWKVTVTKGGEEAK